MPREYFSREKKGKSWIPHDCCEDERGRSSSCSKNLTTAELAAKLIDGLLKERSDRISVADSVSRELTESD